MNEENIKRLLSLVLVGIMMVLVFVALSIPIGAIGTQNGDYNVMEVGEPNIVLIGQMLRFQEDDLGHYIVGLYPEEIEGLICGYATEDYNTTYYLENEGRYCVDRNENGEFDPGETVLLADTPIMYLKITAEGIPVSTIEQGTNFMIYLSTNLDNYDSVNLKVIDPGGYLLKIDPTNHSQIFGNLTVEIVKDMLVYTKDWKIGTYQIWIDTNKERAQGLDFSSNKTTLTIQKADITINAEKTELAKLEWDKLTVKGISNHNITIDSSDPAHTIFPIGIEDNPFFFSIPFNDTIDADGVRTYVVYFNDTGAYTIKVTDTDTGLEDTVDITVSGETFDTGSPANPYPAISGTHNGTITPSYNLSVSKLYTYPCSGTGGHTEYARIWNSTLGVNATWNGYVGDWHNITFNEPITLFAEKTYYYEIRTGSYPQIIHTDEWEAKGGMGIINCTSFVDANGKIYANWIPAIRLWAG
ncbi:MAG: hypothetical protein J7K81_02810 [Methanophagales archaeon]|nr:hypothetical protein [Methanophagales archaeon]